WDLCIHARKWPPTSRLVNSTTPLPLKQSQLSRECHFHQRGAKFPSPPRFLLLNTVARFIQYTKSLHLAQQASDDRNLRAIGKIDNRVFLEQQRLSRFGSDNAQFRVCRNANCFNARSEERRVGKQCNAHRQT